MSADESKNLLALDLLNRNRKKSAVPVFSSTAPTSGKETTINKQKLMRNYLSLIGITLNSSKATPMGKRAKLN